MKSKPRFVFVCGGVISGLGKGITSASLGFLLKNAGFLVTSIKIDPYVSIDAGTMRPQEHGEVFVTKDGGEIDQDLGNYERFLHEDFTKEHNITTGKVYAQVIDNERHFVYQGRDAEVIPDVINEIKRRIYKVAAKKDFVLVEIGGTVGDIENMPFLIAAREIGREHPAAYLMVTYLPFLRTVGELKTKPTQHAVMLLRQVGINPDFIVTRAEEPVDEPRLDTISKRCFVDRDRIFDIPDLDSIYRVPQVLVDQGVVRSLLKFFKIQAKDHSNKLLSRWNDFVSLQSNPKIRKVKVALVGKYVQHGNHSHNDTYISVLEALRHACYPNKVGLNLIMISAEDLNEQNYQEKLRDFAGILVPQGWGSRGAAGKLLAIQYAREHQIPYLGLCYGMQMATIEFARNVAGIKDANSAEIDERTKNAVIHVMPDQAKYLAEKQYGGTIRLGAWPCLIKPQTKLEEIYRQYDGEKTLPWHQPRSEKDRVEVKGQLVVYERHRHRYEFNNDYRERLEKAGLVISGTSPDGRLVEAIELKNHPFFVGTQFHPEYLSRPLTPHPIFVAFIHSMIK